MTTVFAFMWGGKEATCHPAVCKPCSCHEAACSGLSFVHRGRRAGPRSGARHLDPSAGRDVVDRHTGVQVLDVRTKEEFATGHLANATLIPWTDKNFTDRAAKELDPRKPVLVYCQGGVRSAKAAAALVKLGFTEVRDMAGGIAAWQQAGKPTDKVAPKP